jgi:GT2 family glycosyltransferase
MPSPAVTIVIPNWNGRSWLPGCLAAVAAQTLAPAQTIVVDNGSTDGSLEYLAAEQPQVRVIELEQNTGFAHAANRGVAAARTPYVALINTDVELAPDWVQRTAASLDGDPATAAVACKMVSFEDPAALYDTGDILRRDGACEQRGRFERDTGRYDSAGEVFGACAGAALYRRRAVLEVGGFDERLFAYLEDVELALKLRLAGWRCRYEPVVARHAGGGSSHQLPGGPEFLVQRNTLVLVARWFPLRWLPLVAYRQLGWARAAARGGTLRSHLRASRAALPLVAHALRERRLRPPPTTSIEAVVEARPIRGPAAAGHRSRVDASWR